MPQQIMHQTPTSPPCSTLVTLTGTKGNAPLPAVTVSADYLEASVNKDCGKSVRRLVSKCLCQPAPRSTQSGWSVWRDGAKLRPSRDQLVLTLTGDPMQAVQRHGNLDLLIEGLESMDARTRRLDIAGDFPRRFLPMSEVVDAAHAGDFTHFKRVLFYSERLKVGTQMLSKGRSVRFGVPGWGGSGESVCFYDRYLATDGQHDATRMELRLSRYVPDEFFEEYWDRQRNGFSLKQLMAERLAACIDFKRRGVHRNVDRMPRLPWFDKCRAMLTAAASI